MNPFVFGKYVCGREVHTCYSLIADADERECYGHGPYKVVKHFRNTHGIWHRLDWSHFPFHPIPVFDHDLIAQLERVRSYA